MTSSSWKQTYFLEFCIKPHPDKFVENDVSYRPGLRIDSCMSVVQSNQFFYGEVQSLRVSND